MAQASSPSGLGSSGLVHAGQLTLVLAAAVATMWSRPGAAVVLVGAVVALVVTIGPCGEEIWLVIVVGVTTAVRAEPWQLGAVLLGQAGYAAGLGLVMEREQPGWGWPAGLAMLGLAAAGLAAGLVARRLLQARDRRRLRVRELERENAEIRAVERARLADELQTLVTSGLATIDDELAAASRPAATPESLRRTLTQVDLHSRSLLSELRILLEVLRRDPPAAPEDPAVAARSRFDLLTVARVRTAATAVLGLLAARAVLGSLGSPSQTEAAVQAIGLLACALVVWWPVAGASCAVAALAVSMALHAPGYWDALSSTLLCVMGAFRLGPRRFWVIILPVAAYGGLLTVTDPRDAVTRVVTVGYLAILGMVVGLAARHFVAAREESLSRLVDLTDARGRVASEERSAVARELHDVVAHQLSVTTMLVLATSLSEDCDTLETTLERVRRCAGETHRELGTLMLAMRSPTTGEAGETPLITPLAIADALAEQLADNGYRAAVDIDPSAGSLDATTQRTLSRIMQEAVTNVLRYTPPGSTCAFDLSVDDTGVRLTITSPLAGSTGRSDLSLGWGLRGVRERVELTGGAFTAGPEPHGDSWMVAVALPPATDVTLPLTTRTVSTARQASGVSR